MREKSRPHLSVMPQEFLLYFAEKEIRVFFEGTLGAGGHAKLLLEAHPEIEHYIGCDRDPLALGLAGELLAPWKEKTHLVHTDFAHLDKVLERLKIDSVDGFFFDLGVSSMQLDQGEKGFSFSKEGPLDMRMDPEGELTADEIINKWSEKKIGELFRDYGEDPRWRKAAAVIVESRRRRPIKTTTQLADLLSEHLGRIRGKLHPATLIFQALRICVNRELDALQQGLEKAIQRLSPGGRLGVISFHRLEDRIVKEAFRAAAIGKKGVKLLTKKPLVPTLEEEKRNSRARSAKMRFLEKEVVQ